MALAVFLSVLSRLQAVKSGSGDLRNQPVNMLANMSPSGGGGDEVGET